MTEELELFEPSKELHQKLTELNGITPKNHGGRREGSGRKKKDGSDPKPIKPEPPKVFPKPDESPRLEHSAESLLDASTASKDSQGHKTKKEIKESLLDTMLEHDLDVEKQLADMLKYPEKYGISGETRLREMMKMMDYKYSKKKSIEKKEKKDCTINIVRRDFAICPDTGEVIDV